jgi:hypothetical protein
MHTSGFVALAVLILAIAVAVLVLTKGETRRDTAHGPPPPPVTLGR